MFRGVLLRFTESYTVITYNDNMCQRVETAALQECVLLLLQISQAASGVTVKYPGSESLLQTPLSPHSRKNHITNCLM